MRNPPDSSTTFLLGTALLLFTIPAIAQTGADYEVPRTEFGHPDFQRIWVSMGATPFERPEGITELVVNEEQGRQIIAGIQENAPELEDPDVIYYTPNQLGQVRGEYRSSVVMDPADGIVPFTEAGLAQAEQWGTWAATGFDHPEQRPLTERCMESWGFAPVRLFPFLFVTSFIQTETHVVMLREEPGGPRIISLADQAPEVVHPSFEGHSIGRWEGDTLVVETSHIRDDAIARTNNGRPIVVGANTRIEERFTRVTDREIVYRYTVEDPEFYTQPWSGEFSFTAYDGTIYEYACHEGNYSIVGALMGGRVADRDNAVD